MNSEYTVKQALDKIYFIKNKALAIPTCLIGMRVRLMPVSDNDTQFSETLDSLYERTRQEQENIFNTRLYMVAKEDMKQDMLKLISKCKTIEEVREALNGFDG